MFFFLQKLQTQNKSPGFDFLPFYHLSSLSDTESVFVFLQLTLKWSETKKFLASKEQHSEE